MFTFRPHLVSYSTLPMPSCSPAEAVLDLKTQDLKDVNHESTQNKHILLNYSTDNPVQNMQLDYKSTNKFIRQKNDIFLTLE